MTIYELNCSSCYRENTIPYNCPIWELESEEILKRFMNSKGTLMDCPILLKELNYLRDDIMDSLGIPKDFLSPIYESNSND